MGAHTDFDDVAAAPKSAAREYAETILICVVVIVFLRAFIFQQSEIPSGSMEDTILVGDYVLVNRFLEAPTSFAWERSLLPIRDVRRGDVIVFKHPDTPEQDYIKRVIGLPGDTVELRSGRLRVNGVETDEPYINDLYRRADPKRNFGPVQVIAGHYFVMGDHRNLSADSRFWGQVPARLLKGRAFMILFSTRPSGSDNGPPGQVTPTRLLKKFTGLLFRARWDRWFRSIP